MIQGARSSYYPRATVCAVNHNKPSFFPAYMISRASRRKVQNHHIERWFSTVEMPDVELAVGHRRTVDVSSGKSARSQPVQVTETVDTSIGLPPKLGVDRGPTITQLPISGRNWASLSLLVPAPSITVTVPALIRFSGHSWTIAISPLTCRHQRRPGGDAEGRHKVKHRSDSIAEFRVSTGVYTAESGAAGGAQLKLFQRVAKPFHGSAFYALRKDALDARRRSIRKHFLRFTPTSSEQESAVLSFRTSFSSMAISKVCAKALARPSKLCAKLPLIEASVFGKSPSLKPILDATPQGGQWSMTHKTLSVLWHRTRL